MKRIDVAVGVLRRGDQVLVGQRLVRDQYYRKWEFPGGKLESGESPEQALTRELQEELGTQICRPVPLIRLDHDYPDRQVRLHVYEVGEFVGEPVGKEGQAIQWLPAGQCAELDFLQANTPIVNALLLPPLLLITHTARFGVKATVARVAHYARQAETFIVQIREPQMPIAQLRAFVGQLRAAGAACIVLNGDPQVASRLLCDGVHLSAAAAKPIQHREQLPDFWVGMSCHDTAELQHAASIADYALLSPVQATQTHPQAPPMGWAQFAQQVAQAKLPCYALGGVSASHVLQSRQMGGQGVAMISGAWS